MTSARRAHPSKRRKASAPQIAWSIVYGLITLPSASAALGLTLLILPFAFLASKKSLSTVFQEYFIFFFELSSYFLIGLLKLLFNLIAFVLKSVISLTIFLIQAIRDTVVLITNTLNKVLSLIIEVFPEETPDTTQRDTRITSVYEIQGDLFNFYLAKMLSLRSLSSEEKIPAHQEKQLLFAKNMGAFLTHLQEILIQPAALETEELKKIYLRINSIQKEALLTYMGFTTNTPPSELISYLRDKKAELEKCLRGIPPELEEIRLPLEKALLACTACEEQVTCYSRHAKKNIFVLSDTLFKSDTDTEALKKGPNQKLEAIIQKLPSDESKKRIEAAPNSYQKATLLLEYFSKSLDKETKPKNIVSFFQQRQCPSSPQEQEGENPLIEAYPYLMLYVESYISQPQQ